MEQSKQSQQDDMPIIEDDSESNRNIQLIKQKYDLNVKSLNTIQENHQIKSGVQLDEEEEEQNSQQHEQRLAFIISNWDYKSYPKHNQINLKNPLKDLPAAKSEIEDQVNKKGEKNLELVLKNHGFHVQSLVNIKASNEDAEDIQDYGFKQIIAHIQNKIQEADKKEQDIVIFFAYMGHGFSKQSASNDLYALSYDYKAINIDFLGLLSRMSSRCKIIGLLDCCRTLMKDQFIDKILQKDLFEMKKYKSYEGALAFEQEYLIIKAKISQVTVDRDNATMALKKVLKDKPHLTLGQCGDEIQKVNQNVEIQKGGKLLFQFQDPAFLKNKQIKLQKILACLEDYHGVDDIENLKYMYELAEVYKQQNLHEKQRQLLERNVKIKQRWNTRMEQNDQKEFLDIVDELKALSEAYIGLDDEAKAQKYIQQTLENIEKDLFETSKFYGQIGKMFQQKGKYTKSMDNFQKCFELYKKLYGEDSLDISFPLSDIGNLHFKQANYDEALNCLFKSLDLQIRYLGEQCIEAGENHRDIGAIFMKLNEFDRALEHFTKGYEIQVQYFGENSIETSQNLLNIGVVHEKRGNFKQALKNYKKCLDIQQKHFGEGHIETEIALNNVGVIHEKQDKIEDAMKIYIKCLEIQEKHYGKGNIETAVTLKNIGNLYRAMRNLESAVEKYSQSLKIQQQFFGLGHIETDQLLGEIGFMKEEQQNYQEALQYFNQSLEIRKKFHGIDHEATKDTLYIIERIKIKM